MAKSNSSSPKDNPAGIFVPAGVLGGMGVGFATNNIAAGLFIGLGLGFALMAITTIMLNNK